MYNIFKGQIVPSEDDAAKIIDSNERMNQVFEAQRERMEQLAEEHRQELIEAYLMSLTADEEGKPVIPTDENGEYILPHDEDGTQLLYVTSDGYLSEEEEIIEEEPEPEPEEPEEELPPEPELEPEPQLPPVDREAILAEVTAEADAIKKQAQADAEEILEQARAEAEQLKNDAASAGHEEGFASGHAEGLSQASEECEAKIAEQAAQMQNELAQATAAMQAEKDTLAADFARQQEEMEQQMATVFCDIIDKVFQIEFSDKKEIILHLVDNVITNTASSKEYLIRVNDANYDLIQENRAALIDKLGGGVELDIVKDPLLGIEECQIETDGGVFDCGMDVELSNLLKDLKALSLV